MQKKEYEEFFRKLPRKELQSLCKKCSLPARKSSSHMVESLLFYFQRKGYISSDEWITGNREALHPMPEIPVLQPDSSLIWNGNAIRDNAGISRSSAEKGITWNGNTSYNEGAQFHFSPQYAPQFCSGNMNGGVNSSSMVSSSRVSSFEFFVRSEEGLNLCVDLSSNPSDWIKKCKEQVNLSENLSTTRSCGLHHEIGRMGESNNKQINGPVLCSVDPGEIVGDGHAQNEISPSPAMEENFPMGVLHSDEGNISTMSLPTCRKEVKVQGCSGKDKVPIQLKSNSVVQNMKTLNTEVGVKNGCSGTLESDMTDTPMEKTACNFGVNSSSDGSVDLNAVDHQNLKPNGEVYENSTMQDSCNHENTSIAHDHQNLKPDDEVCENSALQDSCNLDNNSVAFVQLLNKHSVEMELSETENHNKDTRCPPHKNKEFFYLVDLEDNMRTGLDALANPSEIGPSRNPVLSCFDEQELSNVVNRRESSVCSEVDNSFEKTCSKSDNLESNRGSQRKRLFVDNEGLSDCSNMKFLRSMKHSAGEVLPRRSTRLVSKVRILWRSLALDHEKLGILRRKPQAFRLILQLQR